jgi:hypothetical protein
MVASLTWLASPVAKALVLALAVPRYLLGYDAPAAPGAPPDATAPSKLQSSRVTLQPSARRFARCLSKDDVNIDEYVAATDEFVSSIERFGDFTRSAVKDARANLRRVSEAMAGGRFSSMRALLRDELRRGARRPEGGPASSSASEALLWSRLGVSFWVETFKQRLRARAPLPEASRSSFQRTIGRYLDRLGRAAFYVASRRLPDWDIVRQRTHLGCRDGVCSEDDLARELESFVRSAEPVLDRMTKLQKSVDLEDPRTP